MARIFVEVHLNSSVEACEGRDTQGHYARARRGEYRYFPGVHVDYEAPQSPEISIDVISASVEYPGASPTEVEEAICILIEEALHGLQGIKRIKSTASEGQGSVSVELMIGEDVRRRLDEVRNRIDRIESFPDNAALV